MRLLPFSLTGKRLARRFAVWILVFSSVVTLVSTVSQLTLEYLRDVSAIEVQLRQIRSSYSESLASSVWIASVKDVELQLQGILRLPDLQYIEVQTESGAKVAQVGKMRESGVVSHDFPLMYMHRQRSIMIGNVHVVANLDGAYQRLKDKVVVILISQTIKTFLVSLFILVLFQWLVGRHLRRIADYSDRMFTGEMDRPLALERQARPEEDELDQVTGALNAMRERLRASFQDLHTANESMEQQVHERTFQLEQANKELEAFSYSVSHDLRSPLRGIDGWSLALQEDYAEQLDLNGRQYIERVRAETQRMGQLIDGMLEFSRLGRTAMSDEAIDMSALANAVAGRVREAAGAANLIITVQEGLQARGDRRLIESVLHNLIENAAKFSSGQACARVEFGRTRMTPPDGEAQVDTWFVRDNGAGFDMAYAAKLFGVFQRLHKASEFPGTGIGLATVQRIVRRHGGRIWAQSALGQGACFYFFLKES